MAKKQILTPAKHKRQIRAYTKIFPKYKIYAEVLKRILEKACKACFPDAFVQSRPKSVSSFAEKVARKYEIYPNAVKQMTDLCGARIILQTVEQVEAAKQFIKQNFNVNAEEEKGVMLGEDRFGYRDMHYIIQLKPECNKILGISSREYKVIKKSKAELQVRTWLQHAWADTLHDRLYKNPLKPSKEIKRTGNLLAALMEEGDRNYNNLAHELDGMIANYVTYVTKKEVEKEIKIQELIFNNESDRAKKPGLAIKLAHLYAASGNYSQVIKLLNPYIYIKDSRRCELIQTLGYAICKVHRDKPNMRDYRRGCKLLKEAIDLCCCENYEYVPHLRRRESFHARSLVRYAWALSAIRRRHSDALEYYHQAHEHEPSNPYYLADMLGFEIYYSRSSNISNAMRTTLREGIKTCRAHAEAGIELPCAYFVAGRLCLLLEQFNEALEYYARGIFHCLAGTHCVQSDALENEIDWIEKLHYDKQPLDGCQWVLELLDLAKQVGRYNVDANQLTPKAIILSGGAASLDKSLPDTICSLLEELLYSFKGIVISGGTKVGVPGCAGIVAKKLALRKVKKFKLIGYIPEPLPPDAEEDKRYDHIHFYGESKFSPDQILQSWRDLLAQRIAPHEVLCVGFGGGPISAVEYKIALALGARAVIAYDSKGTADTIVKDTIWSGIDRLMPLPMDKASFQALLTTASGNLKQPIVLEMAKDFHARYVVGSSGKMPDNMRPWEKLCDTYQNANIKQAEYAVVILEKCGFVTRRSKRPVIFNRFTKKDIQRMAELEHGRWNIERLRDGWRPGKIRDDARKIHDCLVSWKDLPEEIKKYDYDAVRAFPEILAKVGLEVYRK